MKNIEEFLKRFTIIKDPAKSKDEVSSIIKTICGVTVDKTNLVIQNGRLNIKAHPGIKGVIFIKKESLLEEIQKQLPDLLVSSIV